MSYFLFYFLPYLCFFHILYCISDVYFVFLYPSSLSKSIIFHLFALSKINTSRRLTCPPLSSSSGTCTLSFDFASNTISTISLIRYLPLPPPSVSTRFRTFSFIFPPVLLLILSGGTHRLILQHADSSTS